MSTATEFGFITRRRLATGILAFAALGSMALLPSHHASASPVNAGSFSSVQAIYIDSDGDGASDSAEEAFGSDPYDASSYPEVQAGPEDVDTDGDGASDNAEEAFGSDPNDASSYPEVQAGPEQIDTDGDGAPDSAEEAFGSDPNDPSDFPAVQAGPEDGDDVDVTSLPSTGAGERNDAGSYSDELIYIASAGLLVAGALAGKRMRNGGDVR
jgi:hypothetical protein